MENDQKENLTGQRETPDTGAPSPDPANAIRPPAIEKQPTTQIEKASGFKQISAAEVIEKRPGRVVVDPTDQLEVLANPAHADFVKDDITPLTVGYRNADGQIHVCFSKPINVLIMDRNQAIGFANTIKKRAMDLPFSVDKEKAGGSKGPLRST